MLPLRLCLPPLLLLLASGVAALRAQIPTGDMLPEKLRLEREPGQSDTAFLCWNGRAGVSYFIQTTPELGKPTEWHYLPVIETGQDAPFSYGLTLPSPRFFARLVIHPETSEDPLNTDFDGDGVSNIDEINRMLDPLSNRDDDGDGLSDYKETRCGTDPLLADTDGVPDAEDGWPRDPVIRQAPQPEDNYMVLPLQSLVPGLTPTLSSPDSEIPLHIDDRGRLFTRLRLPDEAALQVGLLRIHDLVSDEVLHCGAITASPERLRPTTPTGFPSPRAMVFPMLGDPTPTPPPRVSRFHRSLGAHGLF